MNAGRKCRSIELALDNVLRTPLVEAEDFVVKVKAGDDEVEAVGHAYATLRIDLDMRVEIDIAERTVHSARQTVLVLVPIFAVADASGGSVSCLAAIETWHHWCSLGQSSILIRATKVAPPFPSGPKHKSFPVRHAHRIPGKRRDEIGIMQS